METEDTLAPYRELSFMKSRLPALDALSTFVPEGEEDAPDLQAAINAKGFSRWFPVDGGQVVLIPYEGQEFDQERFKIEGGAWDHEHCKVCSADIEPMTPCWVTESGPYVILCSPCHDKLEAT